MKKKLFFQKNNKKGISYTTITSAILIAFFLFGVFKLATDTIIDEELKSKIVSNSLDKPVWASLYIKILDDLTPTIYLNYLNNKHIYLITDFPVFTWTHTIIILILFAIANMIMNLLHTSRGIKVLVFILLLIFGYFLASILIYLTYILSAKMLGFTIEEANQIRLQYNSGFDNVVLPLLISSLVVFINISRTIIQKTRK